MKILIIARGYPTEKYNLNGIFEFDQAKALAKIGHEVFFYVWIFVLLEELEDLVPLR